jgi:hypothetical protein
MLWLVPEIPWSSRNEKLINQQAQFAALAVDNHGGCSILDTPRGRPFVTNCPAPGGSYSMNRTRFAAHCARRAKELRKIAAGLYDKEERRILETIISEFHEMSLRAGPQIGGLVPEARGQSGSAASNTYPRRHQQ